MTETLLTLVLGLAVLAVVYGVGKWAGRMEQRALLRSLLDRVYYPKRGAKAVRQTVARRQPRPHGDDGVPFDE